MTEGKKVSRERDVPEFKKELVVQLAEKIKSSSTVLIASTKGLPASQFQKIKKKLRANADVLIAKKSLVLRAIDAVGKEGLIALKKEIGSDVALFFSNEDAFELSGMLSDNQSPTKAKAGDIALEDIKVEPGMTDLLPGPAISELGSVGLKIAVTNGKLEIKQGATIVKEGEAIKGNVAGVMAKLGIEPMKVGFIPIAAYDSNDDKVYVGIRINKEESLEGLRVAIAKGLSFAINMNYVCNKTIGYFIAKAGAEAKALENLGLKSEEVAPEGVPSDEGKEEVVEKEITEEVVLSDVSNDKEVESNNQNGKEEIK